MEIHFFLIRTGEILMRYNVLIFSRLSASKCSYFVLVFHEFFLVNVEILLVTPDVNNFLVTPDINNFLQFLYVLRCKRYTILYMLDTTFAAIKT